jgi:hypothetical protein
MIIERETGIFSQGPTCSDVVERHYDEGTRGGSTLYFPLAKVVGEGEAVAVRLPLGNVRYYGARLLLCWYLIDLLNKMKRPQRGAYGESFKVGYAGSLAMNLGSTPRWVWIAVAVMAIAAAEYLMRPQIPH